MEEFKPKRKNTAQPAQNGQSAPHTRKPRTPKPQGENAANAQHILSDTELDGLKTELPGKWEYYIDRLSCHIASSGRKYKSHAATIFKWAQEDAAKKAPKKGIPDYTCKEGESL